MWIIRKAGTKTFVAPSGAKKSYTPDRLRARRFPTKEAAEADSCGNERVVPLIEEQSWL